MSISRIVRGTVLTSGVGVGLASALGVFLGRKAVLMPEPKSIEFIVDESGKNITLPYTEQTKAPGLYGLWFNKTDHAVIGDVFAIDEPNQTVTRKIETVTSGDLREVTSGRWSGHVFSNPSQVPGIYQDIQIPTDSGSVPAWQITPENVIDKDTWAIHIHGMRTSRVSVLRTVPAANELGITSLVPSFYGDLENLGDGSRACHFGQLEWKDIEAALEYAVQQGAKQFILFGWSMGATISLLLTEKSKYKDRIKALVLISPGLDLREVLRSQITSKGFPAWISELLNFTISSKWLSKLCNLKSPIDFSVVEWAPDKDRLAIPTLLIHSQGDHDVPFKSTRQFVDNNSSKATLVEFAAVPHQSEWNAEPKVFEEKIIEWITELFVKKRTE